MNKITNLIDTNNLTIKSYIKIRKHLIRFLKNQSKNPRIWILLAELEKKMNNYRKYNYFILNGIKENPKSESLWLEYLENKKFIKSNNLFSYILNKIPSSEKLWLLFYDYTEDKKSKIKILYQSLMKNPSSSTLWKTLIQQTTLSKSKKIIYRAIECCPHVYEFWKTLINIENYKNSKKIINFYRSIFPNRLDIWVTGALLEESQGNSHNAFKIIKRYFKFNTIKFSQNTLCHYFNNVIAVETSRYYYPITLKALLYYLIKIVTNSKIKTNQILNFIPILLNKGKHQSSHEILKNLCLRNPTNIVLWFKYVYLKILSNNNKSINLIIKFLSINLFKIEIIMILNIKNLLKSTITFQSKSLEQVKLKFSSGKINIYNLLLNILIKSGLNQDCLNILKNIILIESDQSYNKLDKKLSKYFELVKNKFESLILIEKSVFSYYLNNILLEKYIINLLNNKEVEFSDIIQPIYFIKKMPVSLIKFLFSKTSKIKNRINKIIRTIGSQITIVSYHGLIILLFMSKVQTSIKYYSSFIIELMKIDPSNSILLAELLIIFRQYNSKYFFSSCFEFIQNPLYFSLYISNFLYYMKQISKSRLFYSKILSLTSSVDDPIFRILIQENMLHSEPNINFVLKLSGNRYLSLGVIGESTKYNYLLRSLKCKNIYNIIKFS